MWYRACKTCNKKVTEALGSGYWCEGCQKNDDACNLSYRYIMVVKVSDASGEAYLSVFNEQAERIIGCTADELNEKRQRITIRVVAAIDYATESKYLAEEISKMKLSK